MTARTHWPRALAMLLGLALLSALCAVPARAIEAYPGETQEAFAARAHLDQQSKLAEADAAGTPAKGIATGGSESLGAALKLSLFGLVMLVVGGLRMSRGIFRASRTIAKASGAGNAGESFEDRLAERLRELERTEAAPAAPSPSAASPAPVTRRPLPAGPRTFGKRVT